MARVEPLPGEPAATASLAGERALVVADYHAGIEAALRYERGVELESAAADRRERLFGLLDRTGAERLVVLGDLAHRIGDPRGDERDELDGLLATLPVPLTLARGNHDGGAVERYGDRLDPLPSDGALVGDVGLVHGHTWPAPELFGADVVCMGHEHPAVKLTDSVGGSRVERAWLRGRLDREAMAEGLGLPAAELPWGDPELVVFPAFNERSGGTWVNVPGQEFLSPFLPEALVDGQLYLLDGTRLGDYRSV